MDSSGRKIEKEEVKIGENRIIGKKIKNKQKIQKLRKNLKVEKENQIIGRIKSKNRNIKKNRKKKSKIRENRKIERKKIIHFFTSDIPLDTMSDNQSKSKFK